VFYEVSFKKDVIMAGIALVARLFLAYLKLAWFYFFPLPFNVALVLIVDALNTGIEAIADLFSEGQNELARYARNNGSKAVFISIMFILFSLSHPLLKGSLTFLLFCLISIEASNSGIINLCLDLHTPLR